MKHKEVRFSNKRK